MLCAVPYGGFLRIQISSPIYIITIGVMGPISGPLPRNQLNKKGPTMIPVSFRREVCPKMIREFVHPRPPKVAIPYG